MASKCNTRANLLLIIIAFVVIMYLNAAWSRALDADGRLVSESASAPGPACAYALGGLVSNIGSGELSSASLNLLDA